MKRSQDHSLCQQHQNQPSSLGAPCEDENSGTTLKHAKERRHSEVIALLRAAGAKE